VTPNTSLPVEEHVATATNGSRPLGGDFDTFFNPLESRKLRVALIDPKTFECRASWSIANCVVVAADTSERGWSTASPSFAKIVDRLQQASLGEVFVKQLGLERCLYVWRTEPGLIAVAEVSSHDRVSTRGPFRRASDVEPAAGGSRARVSSRGPFRRASDVAPAAVKAICSAAIRVGETTAESPAISSVPSPGDAGSRGARWSWVRAGWACVVSLLVCAALAGWLFAKTSVEMSRVRTLMDVAMLRSLSLMLAKSDYGEVQELLSTYGDSGYFSQAAVSNAKQRVVAIAGTWPKVQIGEPVPDAVARMAETFDLRLGSDSLGRLLIAQPRATPLRLVKSGLHSLRVSSAWLSGVALAAALMLSAFLMWMPLLARTSRRRLDAVAPSTKN
jgi:hypothetical protein